MSIGGWYGSGMTGMRPCCLRSRKVLLTASMANSLPTTSELKLQTECRIFQRGRMTRLRPWPAFDDQRFDWLEQNTQLCGLLHCRPRVKHRKVFPSQPHLCQIAIVRIVRIARLPGIVHRARIVPITYVDNHPKRGSAGLFEVACAIGCYIRCVGAAWR